MVLALLIILFLIIRLAVLFTALDKLYEPEELYRGTIAREIIHGPLIPLWDYLDYKVEYFPGGTLVVGILAVPFFFLFGQTYIALKLVGLSFSLFTFVCWFLFLDRFFSRRAAVLSALLFIFPMPFYTKSSLVTWGSHPEANLFAILGLYVFYVIFLNNQGQDRKQFLFLGAISGFGLWFIQTYLVALLFIFTAWFIFDKRLFLRKAFFIFCAGFSLGFSPGILYEFAAKRADTLLINGKAFFSDLLISDLNIIPSKLVKLFICDLPNSFLFEGFLKIKGAWISYFYYLLFLIAFMGLAWQNRQKLLGLFRGLAYPVTLNETNLSPFSAFKEALILFYPVFFAACYILSGYFVSVEPWDNPQLWLDYIGFRYMMPAMPFILAMPAVFTSKIKGIFSRLVFFALLGLGLLGNLSLISLPKLGTFVTDRGYSYNIIGDKVGLRVTQDLRGYLRHFERLSPELKADFYEGLGAGIAWRLRDNELSDVISVFAAELPPEYKPYAYKGWGGLYSPESEEEFLTALEAASLLDDDRRCFFYEGLGRKMGFFDKLKDMRRTEELLKRIEKRYWPFCYSGLGYKIGFEFKHNKIYRDKLIDEINPEYRSFVIQGIVKGMQAR